MIYFFIIPILANNKVKKKKSLIILIVVLTYRPKHPVDPSTEFSTHFLKRSNTEYAQQLR